uniref:Synaptophysin like 1 n=1 Tax=Equus caballus TaxID=9796 RepID=F6Z0R7_HORSE
MSSFQLNLSPLKEPLGFIKVLEWIASIFAFATCGGFKGKTEIQVSCPKTPENRTITAAFGYPFRLNQVAFQAPPGVNVCDVEWRDHVLIGDYSSSAQFYVTFAVFVFLYCMAALLLYLGYTSLYRDSRKLTMTDFVITLVATFLWLVSTSAWAKALTDIKIATGPNIVRELGPCNQRVTCHFGSVTSMGSLNVSVLLEWGAGGGLKRGNREGSTKAVPSPSDGREQSPQRRRPGAPRSSTGALQPKHKL